MKALVRITAGLALAVTPVALSVAPEAHAATITVNETCVSNPLTFTLPTNSTPIPLWFNAHYTRAWTNTCVDLDVSTPPAPIGVTAPIVVAGNSGGGFATGTCAAAVLTGDFRNGVGVLLGGSVVLGASAFPLTPGVFAEAEVLVPNNLVPCLNETSATGVAVNDSLL